MALHTCKLAPTCMFVSLRTRKVLRACTVERLWNSHKYDDVSEFTLRDFIRFYERENGNEFSWDRLPFCEREYVYPTDDGIELERKKNITIENASIGYIIGLCLVQPRFNLDAAMINGPKARSAKQRRLITKSNRKEPALVKEIQRTQDRSDQDVVQKIAFVILWN